MDQTERNQVISAFKKKEMPILVATDVAGDYNSILSNFCAEVIIFFGYPSDHLSIRLSFCVSVMSDWRLPSL